MIQSGRVGCFNFISDICDRLFGDQARVEPTISNRGVHFFVGDPPLRPPTIRGTILLRLNANFLIENSEKFLVGRPIDLDGIAFGHLPALPNALSKEDLEWDVDRFFAACSSFASLDQNSWKRFSSLRHPEPALEKISHVCPPAALSYMREVESFHARAFEYELAHDYKLTSRHIASLHVPEAYTVDTSIRKLANILGPKLVPYNSKYGLEAVFDE